MYRNIIIKLILMKINWILPMKIKTKTAEIVTQDLLDKIKRNTIVAMFADDDLMDILVLKGGNAMDLVHKLNSRASIDIDLSLERDFDITTVQDKIIRSLKSTFSNDGYFAFDIKMHVRPNKMPDELSSFWGGYLVEFKIISSSRANELKQDLDSMRREAINLGEGTKFTIDISRHEFIEGKEEHELDGYKIFVYSPEMIVFEKLRAICQQMPQYGAVIMRSGFGNQRARDFIDIEALVTKFSIDLKNERSEYMIREIFNAKKVPIDYIFEIKETSNFHKLGFEQVKATMRAGVDIKDFEYYFNFVVDICEQLKVYWRENSPLFVVN